MSAWAGYKFGFSHLYFIKGSNLNWQSKQLKYLGDLNENMRFLVNSVHF